MAQIRGERHFLGARGCRFWEIFFAENFVKKTALADDLRFFETLYRGDNVSEKLHQDVQWRVEDEAGSSEGPVFQAGPSSTG